MAKPLAGTRIADFSFHAACPFAVHLLSLLGAECIKIETHNRLDAYHKPHPVYGRAEGLKFHHVAANKKSVTINLKDPRGLAIAKRLVAVSHAVAESMRPGVMERLGLGYKDLAAVNPAIVYLSLSASGQTGPDRGFGGYAPLFGAWGGLGYLTGWSDGPPVEIRHMMDHSSGMTAALATIGAIYHQRTTGQGQWVDLAARDVASTFIGEALIQAATGGKPARNGNAHETMAPHGVYPCREPDTWVSIAVGTDEEWQGLCALLDGKLSGDARFADPRSRKQNSDALDAALSAWTKQRTPDEAAAMLQTHGVPAFASWDAKAIVEDPHLRARRTIVDFPVEDGTRPVIGTPFHFSKSEAGIERGTPKLGEHNDYVFRELLGMSKAEQSDLEQAQVLY